MGISQFYDDIARCNKCGFCQAACPVFRVTGAEAGVARGRLALLRALIEGRMAWTPEIQDPLFSCLLCGACTSNCFPALPTADLVLAARSEYLDLAGRGPLHRLLFDQLLPYPDRMRLAVRAAALGEKSRLAGTARALGLLRFLGRDFGRAGGIIEQFPEHALRDRFKPGIRKGRGANVRIAYFTGCGMDLVCPQAGCDSVELLLDVGKSVEILNNNCCGLPALSYGDHVAAQRLARQNLELLPEGRFDVIVTDCSSCAAFLKKYSGLFAPDDPAHHSAGYVSERVRDIVEVLRGNAEALPRPKRPKVVVTYHDPCHARRGQKLAREPREILQSLEGVEYRELPEADWCCGGAGSYAISHFDTASRILDRKIDNVAKTGADVLSTSCPACMIYLSYGVRKRGLPIRVRHISEVVAGTTGPAARTTTPLRRVMPATF